MIPRISFLALLAMVLTAAGVEKRSAPERVEGVPEFYWALFRGGISEDEVADFRAQLPYESITLERTPCYGACPVYRVTFHRSGKVELHAERNLPLTGDFTGTLDVLSYGRLCYMLDHFGFRTMKDRYDPPIRWTDDTTCIVSARWGEKEAKAVSDYGMVGPLELWTIQQMLDRFREATKWQAAK